MTKYYKLFKGYYHDLGNNKTERVSTYHHDFGIRRTLSTLIAVDEAEEITEAQYIRVKKLILAKILQNV